MQVATETATVTTLKPATSKSPKVHPSYFFEASNRRNVWATVVAHGAPYDALLKPEYWTHVAKRLRPGDLIEATAEDGSYFAQFFVVSVAPNAAAVVEISKTDLQAIELPDATSGFEVKWSGPVLKFTVTRLADNVRVATGLDTKQAATEAMGNHIKALAR
jgi:hypothetical protein